MFSKNYSKSSMLKASTAAGILGLMLVVTGCSASPQPASSASETPTVKASPAVSETAKAYAAPTAAATAPVSSGTADMAVAGDVVTTKKGKYLQIKLPENSPAYNLGKNVVDDSAKAAFPDSEIQDATKTALNYMVKDIIDPPVIDNELDPAEWWTTAQSDFLPQYAPDAFASLGTLDPADQTSDSFVVENPWWANKEYNGFSYVYNENETRIKNLNMKVVSVTRLPDNPYLVVQADVSYEIPAVYASHVGVKVAKGAPLNKAVQHSSGMVKLAVGKDASGKWVMSGWEKNINSPVTAQ